MAESKRLPAYLVLGTDAVRRKKFVEGVKHKLPADMADFNIDEITVTSALEPATLIGSLNQMPFMADFRLVILHGVENLLKDASEALVKYLGDPNPSCCLVAEGEKLAKNTRLYKAFNKVGKGAIQDFEPARKDYPSLAVEYAARRGMRMDMRAAQELVGRLGESTLMLDNQIATLSELLRDTGQITVADVEANVTRLVEPAPWELADAIASRNLTKALDLFALISDGKYVLLHVAITGKIRELICAHSLVQQGRSGEIATELKRQAWQVKNLAGQARKFSEAELTEALAQAAATERVVKGSGDSFTAMTSWIIGICTGRYL